MPLDKETALRIAWMTGNLKYLINKERPRPHQVAMYDAIWAAINEKKLKYSMLCARRLGKSFVLMLIAFEFAIRNKRSQIRYLAPLQSDLVEYTEEFYNIITQDIQENIPWQKATLPRWNKQKNSIDFPNGSKIRMAGVNEGQARKQRGKSSHLIILDEAGQMDELEDLWLDVLMPTTRTTKGLAIANTTPPMTPDHDFIKWHEECYAAGDFLKFTIDDDVTLDEITKRKHIEEYGGINSTKCRREYYCEFVTEESRMIIPEWKDEYIGISQEAEEWRKYKQTGETLPANNNYGYWHKYEAMDFGTVDYTAPIFGHYNFTEAKLYIEAEDGLRGKDVTTANISERIRVRERELGWEPKDVFRRVADNNERIVLADMSSVYGLSFYPTDKDSREAMVNKVRIFIGQGRLRVSPECKMLIGCLKYGLWNEKANRDFDRSKTYGHYDWLAALVYLIRNLDERTNPVPLNPNFNSYTQFAAPGTLFGVQAEENREYQKLFPNRSRPGVFGQIGR